MAEAGSRSNRRTNPYYMDGKYWKSKNAYRDAKKGVTARPDGRPLAPVAKQPKQKKG